MDKHHWTMSAMAKAVPHSAVCIWDWDVPWKSQWRLQKEWNTSDCLKGQDRHIREAGWNYIYVYSLSVKYTDMWCCWSTCQEISLSEGTWLLLRLLWLATKPQIQDGKLLHQTLQLRCSWGDVPCLKAQEPCRPEICQECVKASKGWIKLPPPLTSRRGWGKSRTGKDSVANWSKETRQQRTVQRKDGQNLCTPKKWNRQPVTHHRGHKSQMASSVWGIWCELQVYGNQKHSLAIVRGHLFDTKY